MDYIHEIMTPNRNLLNNFSVSMLKYIYLVFYEQTTKFGYFSVQNTVVLSRFVGKDGDLYNHSTFRACVYFCD